jgi:PIN domain nuclease of toxin-antitoxin system
LDRAWPEDDNEKGRDAESTQGPTKVILLDTNALIWLAAGHRRARSLMRIREQLVVSPASLFELRLLEEIGKVRVSSFADIEADSRWTIDEPPVLAWFEAAFDLSWTRDIFDRLIVAHAISRRFKIATADSAILERLPKHSTVEL